MLYFLLLLIVLFILSQPITVLLHEVGHAIPMYLFSGKPITIFIGSYGDKNQCFNLRLKIFYVWIGRNPFKWVRRGGFCSFDATEMSIPKQLTYILCGPIASTLVSCTCIYFAFAYNTHGFLKLFLIAFLLSAFFDLLRNLYPDIYPAVLDDGTLVYNDGYQIVRLFKWKKYGKAYDEACDLFDAKHYDQAAMGFEQLIAVGLHDKSVYQLLIDALVQEKQAEKALSYHEMMAGRLPLTSHDFCQLGSIKGYLNEKAESLKAFDVSLTLDPQNAVTIHNKGYFLFEWERYTESIPLFDQAIALAPDLAYAYNNRGAAKVMVGDLQEGLKDIQRSTEMDPANAYCYRSLGMYYLMLGDPTQALIHFHRAKEMQPTTLRIDEWLDKAKEQESRTFSSVLPK